MHWINKFWDGEDESFEEPESEMESEQESGRMARTTMAKLQKCTRMGIMPLSILMDLKTSTSMFYFCYDKFNLRLFI
jgi:hypothetical protein